MAVSEQAPIYKHFDRCTIVSEDGSSIERMKCQLCGKLLAAVKYSSNLERHLETIHPDSDEWLAYPAMKAAWIQRTKRDKWKNVAKIPLTEEQR